MSKQKKGMHKEYHTKRIDSDLDFVLNYVLMLNDTKNLERFGSEFMQAYNNLINVLDDKRGGLQVDTVTGEYLVERGYNWVSDTDLKNNNRS